MSSSSSPPPTKKTRPSFKVPWGQLTIVGWVLGGVLWPFFLIMGLWSTRHHWFPVRKRISRSYYWNGLGLYLCAGGLLAVLIYAVSQSLKFPIGVVYALYGVLISGIALSAVMIAIGRLHDRNISGWWLILYYGLPAALIVGCSVSLFPDVVRIILACPVPYLLIWTIIALGFQVGTAGPNPYGADPVALDYERTRQRQQATASKTVAAGASASVLRSQEALQPPAPAHSPTSSSSPSAPIQPATSPPPFAPKESPRTRLTLNDLFSFQGRFSRKKYWMYFAVQCAFAGLVWAAVDAATAAHAVSRPTYWLLVALLAGLPAGISIMATTVKRLHDWGQSGWWGPAIGVLALVGMELLSLLYNQALLEWGNWGGGAGFAAFIFWLIGSVRGTIGNNRFGPDPVPPPPGVTQGAPVNIQ